LQAGDEFMLWEEEDTIILQRVKKPTHQEMIQGNIGKYRRQNLSFFEIADRLAELNKIDPIYEDEIQQ
jgi:hypothetical protein